MVCMNLLCSLIRIYQSIYYLYLKVRWIYFVFSFHWVLRKIDLIQNIFSDDSGMKAREDPEGITTAIFYSITSTQKGLQVSQFFVSFNNGLVNASILFNFLSILWLLKTCLLPNTFFSFDISV